MPMPGLFGTNNPTPWANPGPVGMPGGGWNFPGKPAPPAAPSLPTAAPAGVPAVPGGTGNAPAAPQAPPAAPAPSTPAEVPGGTGGPGPQPGAAPDDWAFPGLGGSTPTLPGFSPGYPQPPDINQLLAFFQNPGATGNELYGPQGFAALPGSSEFGEETMRTMANLLAMLTGEQRTRSGQAQGIYDNLANANPLARQLSEAAMAQAQSRIDPGALSGYRDQLRSQAASDAGQGYQTTMQRMRDAGLLGRGAMSVDPALAASNQANEGLARRNLDIEGLMEQLTQNRLGQANDLSRGGADIYQNLSMIPQYNRAQRLDQPASTGDQAMLQFLYDQAMLAATGSQAQRNAPTAFERIGVPIIGGALSGASGIGDLLTKLKGLF